MIIVGGDQTPCGPTWHDARLLGDSPGWRTRHRPRPPDSIILHWTAGESSAGQVRRVLGRRGLSVHFIVDGDGAVWQCEDPVSTVCLHAGGANERSVGIEIVNYGWRRRGVQPPRLGDDRRRVLARVHGWQFWHAAFRPEQVTAVLALCDVLTATIPTIPRRVLVHSELADADELAPGGVFGHYHLSARKVDPGPGLLCEVATHWGVLGGGCVG